MHTLKVIARVGRQCTWRRPFVGALVSSRGQQQQQQRPLWAVVRPPSQAVEPDPDRAGKRQAWRRREGTRSGEDDTHRSSRRARTGQPQHQQRRAKKPAGGVSPAQGRIRTRSDRASGGGDEHPTTIEVWVCECAAHPLSPSCASSLVLAWFACPADWVTALPGVDSGPLSESRVGHSHHARPTQRHVRPTARQAHPVCLSPCDGAPRPGASREVGRRWESLSRERRRRPSAPGGEAERQRQTRRQREAATAAGEEGGGSGGQQARVGDTPVAWPAEKRFRMAARSRSPPRAALDLSRRRSLTCFAAVLCLCVCAPDTLLSVLPPPSSLLPPPIPVPFRPFASS